MRDIPADHLTVLDLAFFESGVIAGIRAMLGDEYDDAKIAVYWMRRAQYFSGASKALMSFVVSNPDCASYVGFSVVDVMIKRSESGMASGKANLDRVLGILREDRREKRAERLANAQTVFPTVDAVPVRARRNFQEDTERLVVLPTRSSGPRYPDTEWGPEINEEDLDYADGEGPDEDSFGPIQRYNQFSSPTSTRSSGGTPRMFPIQRVAASGSR